MKLSRGVISSRATRYGRRTSTSESRRFDRSEVMTSIQRFHLPAVLFAALLLAACGRQEGPAERAGKKIDQAVQEAGKSVDAALAAASAAAATAGHKVEAGAKQAGEAVGKAVETTGKAVEKTGEEIRGAAKK